MSRIISTLRLFGAFLRPSIARSILVTTVLCGAGANLLGEDLGKRSCAPLPSGAVSWWPGDGNTNDIVGSNHGQLVGGAKFAPGFVGEAFNLMALTTTSNRAQMAAGVEHGQNDGDVGEARLDFAAGRDNL
jgi:hypothetical protein